MKTPIVKPKLPLVTSKNTFEEALDKLDLQGILLLLTVLSQKALYLQSRSILDKEPLVKAVVVP